MSWISFWVIYVKPNQKIVIKFRDAGKQRKGYSGFLKLKSELQEKQEGLFGIFKIKLRVNTSCLIYKWIA